MPLTSNRKNTNDKPYENPFEEQGYLARIVQIVDLGKQPQTDWQTGEKKESKYEVMITFEFPEVLNDEDMPRWLSRRYAFPQSWPEKTGLKDNTNLYALFSTFVPSCLTQSKKFPAYYFFSDDVWNKLLATPCYVDVAVTKSGRPKVKSVGKVPQFGKNTPKVPELANTPTLFDVGSATVEQWLELYGWVRDMISQAEDEETAECAAMLEDKKVEKEQGQQKGEKPEPEKKEKKKDKDASNNDDFDDSLPF